MSRSMVSYKIDSSQTKPQAQFNMLSLSLYLLPSIYIHTGQRNNKRSIRIILILRLYAIRCNILRLWRYPCRNVYGTDSVAPL